MPIMAAHDENDARGSARVLANTVRKCMEIGKDPPKYASAFDNFYSMLEDYRSHGFVGFAYVQSPTRGPEALTLLPPAERHVLDLRIAFDRALKKAYGDTDKDEALDIVEKVLRAVAYPDTGAVSSNEKQKVKAFLGAFIDNLYSKP